MTATLTNGRSRKSLADQIDRLDSVLDGLSDGLSEAVATAVKEAVAAVLTEVFTSPELLARLQTAQSEAAPPKEVQPSRSWLARAWSGIRSTLRAAVEQVRICRHAVGEVYQAGCTKATEVGHHIKRKSLRLLIAGLCGLLSARHWAAPVVAAATLGGLTGLAAYYLGPWMAAGVSTAGGLSTALGAPVSSAWLRWVWPWRTSAE